MIHKANYYDTSGDSDGEENYSTNLKKQMN